MSNLTSFNRFLRITLLLLIFVLFPISVYSASPPDSISLVFPTSDEIPFNSTVEIGISDPGDTAVNFGLVRIVNITKTLPNGTVEGGVVVGDEKGCRNFPGVSYGENMRLNISGQYTIHWNVTYGLSSDPSQANKSSCGPEPFSWQTFVLNKTFTVLEEDAFGSAGGIKVPLTTSVSQLPSEPTGSFPSGAIRQTMKTFGTTEVLAIAVLVTFAL